MTERVLKKDSKTFEHELEVLFRENHKLIYRAAYSVTRHREDAEDVLQTVFIKLIQGDPSPDFYQNPQGYLNRAATNEALNVVRARKGRKISNDDVYALEITEPETKPDENLDRVNAAIERMTPELAQTINLRYQQELSCREIAKIQRRPLNTVLSDLFRARKELKKLTEEI